MYIVTKYEYRTDSTVTIYSNWVDNAINLTREFIKNYVSEFLKIKNSIDPDYNLKFKYDDRFYSIILYREIEYIDKGYIYNSKTLKTIPEYKFQISYLPKYNDFRQPYNVRVIQKSNMFSNDNLNSGIKQNNVNQNGPNRTIHDKLIKELEEEFKRRNIMI